MTDRPSLEKCLMEFADIIKARSSCDRLNVGCVIASKDLRSIYSFGYNGNATGFPNQCDSSEPGNCGCIHAECNALIKCPIDRNKVLFLTDSPCKMCAKMIVNSGASKVYYRREYRIKDGINILTQAGIEVINI